GRSQSAATPRAWTRQDWMNACLAALIALCLLGVAVWQTLPPGASAPRTREVARDPLFRPVAGSLPADEQSPLSPVNAMESVAARETVVPRERARKHEPASPSVGSSRLAKKSAAAAAS